VTIHTPEISTAYGEQLFRMRFGPSKKHLGYCVRKLLSERLHSMQISGVTSQSYATPPLMYTHNHAHPPQTHKYQHHTAHLIKSAYLPSYRSFQTYPAHPSWCMSSRPLAAQSHPRQQTIYEANILHCGMTVATPRSGTRVLAR
jgi:hypothetical protein